MPKTCMIDQMKTLNRQYIWMWVPMVAWHYVSCHWLPYPIFLFKFSLQVCFMCNSPLTLAKNGNFERPEKHFQTLQVSYHSHVHASRRKSACRGSVSGLGSDFLFTMSQTLVATLFVCFVHPRGAASHRKKSARRGSGSPLIRVKDGSYRKWTNG